MAELHLSFQSVSNCWSSEGNLDWWHWSDRTGISYASQTERRCGWPPEKNAGNDWSNAILGLVGKNNFGKGQTEVLSTSVSLIHLPYSSEKLILHKTHYIHCNNMQRNESATYAATLLQLFTYFKILSMVR